METIQPFSMPCLNRFRLPVRCASSSESDARPGVFFRTERAPDSRYPRASRPPSDNRTKSAAAHRERRAESSSGRVGVGRRAIQVFSSAFDKVLGCLRFSGFLTEFVNNCVGKAFTLL